MGHKPSNNFQSNRPESGGADHHSQRENSGLLGKNKQKFAADRADEQHDESPAVHEGQVTDALPSMHTPDTPEN